MCSALWHVTYKLHTWELRVLRKFSVSCWVIFRGMFGSMQHSGCSRTHLQVHDQHAPSVFYELETGVRIISGTPNYLVMLGVTSFNPISWPKKPKTQTKNGGGKTPPSSFLYWLNRAPTGSSVLKAKLSAELKGITMFWNISTNYHTYTMCWNKQTKTVNAERTGPYEMGTRRPCSPGPAHTSPLCAEHTFAKLSVVSYFWWGISSEGRDKPHESLCPPSY